MNIIEILLISLALASDAFAISICYGLSLNDNTLKKCLIVGFSFGIFQALMPMIGYFLGDTFNHLIRSIDHFVAFSLLLFIGGKMIYETKHKEENEYSDLNLKSLIILSIATSIDALTFGIAYRFAYNTNMLYTFTIIGIVTFILCTIGVKIASFFGIKYKNISQFIGGIVLILFGFKILLEHLFLI